MPRPPRCPSPEDEAGGLMHQRPHQGRPDARWPRAGKTQACITKALISFAIQVGRRERADATSSSSDEGNLTVACESLLRLFLALTRQVPAPLRQQPVQGKSVAKSARVGVPLPVLPISSDDWGRT